MKASWSFDSVEHFLKQDRLLSWLGEEPSFVQTNIPTSYYRYMYEQVLLDPRTSPWGSLLCRQHFSRFKLGMVVCIALIDWISPPALNSQDPLNHVGDKIEDFKILATIFRMYFPARLSCCQHRFKVCSCRLELIPALAELTKLDVSSFFALIKEKKVRKVWTTLEWVVYIIGIKWYI